MQETPVLPSDSRTPPPWLLPLRIFAVVGIIVFVFIRGCIPGFETGFGSETTYDPPGGDPSRFDPIASMDSIQAQVGDGAELIEMSSTFVKSDGTQDLTTDVYFARSDYEFVREVPPPDDAPPIGAGGSASGRWYQITHVDIHDPGQWRQVTGSTSYSYLHKGMALDEFTPTGNKPDTIPPPTCPFSILWQHAIADGVPSDAVANIAYDNMEYEFYISDLGYRARFDATCQKIEE
jgi:hypothetical protein